MADRIKKILMERDGMSAKDADDLIMQAYQDLHDRLAVRECPYNICEEWFGLEPDYLFDLMEL